MIFLVIYLVFFKRKYFKRYKYFYSINQCFAKIKYEKLVTSSTIENRTGVHKNVSTWWNVYCQKKIMHCRGKYNSFSWSYWRLLSRLLLVCTLYTPYCTVFYYDFRTKNKRSGTIVIVLNCILFVVTQRRSTMCDTVFCADQSHNILYIVDCCCVTTIKIRNLIRRPLNHHVCFSC